MFCECFDSLFPLSDPSNLTSAYNFLSAKEGEGSRTHPGRVSRARDGIAIHSLYKVDPSRDPTLNFSIQEKSLSQFSNSFQNFVRSNVGAWRLGKVHCKFSSCSVEITTVNL